MRNLVVVAASAMAGLLCPAAESQAIRWSEANEFVVDDTGNPVSAAPFTPIEYTHAGKPIDAEILWLVTPFVRGDESAGQTRLAVLKLKSSAEDPLPPLVYLAGGPGDSAVNARDSYFLEPLFTQALKTRDVVLMDQRGVGRSRPWALWAAREPLPRDVFLSEAAAIETLRERHESAKTFFEKRDLRLDGFTSVEAADDLEALRGALGAGKISLLSFSYGTHLVLVTLRRHGGGIDRAVLVGTEGLNHTFKLPSVYDEQLDKLTEAVSRQPDVAKFVPDMNESWRRILKTAADSPYQVRVESRGEIIDLPVGPFGLQWIVRRDLGDTHDLPVFPALFYSLERGDTSVLQSFVEKRYSQYGSGVSGMQVMTDLASGATEARYGRIREEAAESLFGNTMNFPDWFIRDIWGNPDLGGSFRESFTSAVPILFVSGTLDCQTPPEQAEAVRRHRKLLRKRLEREGY